MTGIRPCWWQGTECHRDYAARVNVIMPACQRHGRGSKVGSHWILPVSGRTGPSIWRFSLDMTALVGIMGLTVR